MTVSHSAHMLLKLERCIPISHVTLETVPKYATIERPTSSQLYASAIEKCHVAFQLRNYFIDTLAGQPQLWQQVSVHVSACVCECVSVCVRL